MDKRIEEFSIRNMLESAHSLHTNRKHKFLVVCELKLKAAVLCKTIDSSRKREVLNSVIVTANTEILGKELHANVANVGSGANVSPSTHAQTHL